MTKELLEKYLNNRCTSQEVEEVIQWMKQQFFFSESQKLGKVDWQQFKEEDSIVSDEKLDTLLDKIHHKLNIEEPRTIQLRNNRLISLLSKAAAIILIPVLAFMFYTISENNWLTNQITTVSVDSLEVIAPVGSRTVVELSDGTVVHLNYGSRIKYPQNFWGETRGIALTGEGYFEVAHNPDKPFVVNAGRIDVKALGTVFNVNAYPENNSIATTLVEGKVLIEKMKNNGNVETIKELIPGQHVIYEKNTGLVKSSLERVEKYIAWKDDGKLILDNEPIDQVAQRLSRMFNVEIQVDKEMEKYRYTVTFVDEPLFQILDLLSAATPINYRALPRTKNPDGTFSKQRIIIEKKE
ncbi:FecR family protein [Mariniphaga anaerophila]|uniref:FecR family protein n=1 Tax=Mariniphaga anaerophila TaxID=1484053 RepID=A0A1M4UBK8_9BACT|nr:FecR domain-containing protein [Mariniphaga anaerophila]SHE54074.1 FecR family protein [Mariniphaga anaerophila]